jgi:cell division protein FtsI/penicillin-binding protein 2
VSEQRTERAWQCRRLDSWATISLVVITVLLSATVLRVVQLKVWPDPRLAAAAGSQTTRLSEPGRRGDIFDRRGRLIATTTLGYRAFIDPSRLDDPGTIGVDLGALIDLDPIAVDRAITPRLHTKYAPVSDILEPWPQR